MPVTLIKWNTRRTPTCQFVLACRWQCCMGMSLCVCVCVRRMEISGYVDFLNQYKCNRDSENEWILKCSSRPHQTKQTKARMYADCALDIVTESTNIFREFMRTFTFMIHSEFDAFSISPRRQTRKIWANNGASGSFWTNASSRTTQNDKPIIY